MMMEGHGLTEILQLKGFQGVVTNTSIKGKNLFGEYR